MQLGIIGRPLLHTFSPDYFQKKFEQLEMIDSCYSKFELKTIDELPQMLAKHPELRGFNITSPYKEEVLPFLHELDEGAKAVGAVNCVRITHGPNGLHLKGYNTDVVGFRESLQRHLHNQPQQALVLGTGGASKAICFALSQLSIRPIIVSRKSTNEQIAYEEISQELLQATPLIINCTPLGMHPLEEQRPPIPYDLLTPDHFLYDLIYNPEETLFLKAGKEQGCITLNGLEMLYGQAEAGWEIWNKKE